MSMNLMVQVLKEKIGSSARKLVLLKLADNANDAGECFPSYKHIADHCEMGRRTVIRHIKQLQKDGFLTIERRRGQKGNSSNIFRIDLSASRAKPSSDLTPSPSSDLTPSHSANLTPPSANLTPPPSANLAPITSHSFEPVKEPVKEPKTYMQSSACPHEEIIALYHEILPANPKVRIWNDTRKSYLRSRWREDDTRQNLHYWEKLFGYISKSDFLTGKTETPNRRPFMADLEWIVKPSNFVKIIEGKYEN